MLSKSEKQAQKLIAKAANQYSKADQALQNVYKLLTLMDDDFPDEEWKFKWTPVMVNVSLLTSDIIAVLDDSDDAVGDPAAQRRAFLTFRDAVGYRLNQMKTNKLSPVKKR